MAALSTGALIMALFGFVVLFGGLAVALYVAMAGGFEYEDDEEDEEPTDRA
ncbi:MAG TPA: MetS family NSS transporter small subunit [Natrialbaceae archaeon]|nr:MetS family NSS transporter small subunit [Natrialbaceae archaeon]